METWAKTSLILCIFGLLKEFRPSEPFIIPYLLSPAKNFTDVQVNQQIFPVGTYSCLAQLVLVFLVTDLLRYKPVILLEGIAGIITWTLLIVGTNIATMQTLEFFYGTFVATEVAYFTYIYAKVEREHYQRVTSYTRAAFLLGRFSSSIVGQALVSSGTFDYYQLNFLSLGGVSLATAWAFFLPPAERSIYFHPEDDGVDNPGVEGGDVTTVLPPKGYTMHVFETVGPPDQRRTLSDKWAAAYRLLWRDFRDAFTDPYVLKWSVWWALATCGFYQGITYIQVLWETILRESLGTDDEIDMWYNGYIEAVYTVIGAAAAVGCGWLRFNWQVLGEVSLAAGALLQGAALIISAYATNMWLAYACYVVFGVTYNTIITIVNSEVAKHINEDSYGLIFGVNTFFALLLQTILTAVVAAEGGLALAARPQFLVYGGYFVALGAIFAAMAAVTLLCGWRRDQPLWLPNEVKAVETKGAVPGTP